MSSERKIRLDLLLTERGLAPSRSRARDLVRRNAVWAGGEVVTRRGVDVAAALDAFGFDPDGCVCLDIGASTGGFTQMLLRRGAKRVYTVDVGRDQLHATLRGLDSVVSLGGTDARMLDRDAVPDAIAALVADVSFISLTKALPAAFALAAPGAWTVMLVKPQFEAGREAVGKGGIVRSEIARSEALASVERFVASRPGWVVSGGIASPISGQDGNVEYLLGARHAG